MRIVDGCTRTNARAAARAALMRVGSMAVAAMLFETSNARTTVPWRWGRSMVVCGRASPASRTVTPSRKRTTGTCRRHPTGLPARVRA